MRKGFELAGQENYLYQSIDTLKGLKLNMENLAPFGIEKSEEGKEYLSDRTWSIGEYKQIKTLMSHKDIGPQVRDLLYSGSKKYDGIQSLISFINHKKFFVYTIEDEKFFMAVPDVPEGLGLEWFKLKLFNLVEAYVSIEEEGGVEKFFNAINSIRNGASKRLFTKRFKEKYQFKFSGISGVALTGNCSIDGIEIPKWYAKKHNIEIGDSVLCYRDPVQNIFISLKVEGFTANEIRVACSTFTFLDGDFDGDRVQVCPIKFIYSEVRKYLDVTEAENFLLEVEAITPSALKASGNILTSQY